MLGRPSPANGARSLFLSASSMTHYDALPATAFPDRGWSDYRGARRKFVALKR